ncbi:MAG: porin, partial [Gammaproteobacteria bacterium]|nr:porin [Gammaproteobacteria bacterium]
MKKSLIALAVAAALPVAAQADVTLSGSVEAKSTLGGNLAPTITTEFNAAASEVLANGMTAT